MALLFVSVTLVFAWGLSLLGLSLYEYSIGPLPTEQILSAKSRVLSVAGIGRGECNA